jgi:hypothetical protein
MSCRTWEARWATSDLQYAYDCGVFEGAAVVWGLIAMAEAIRERGPINCVACLEVVRLRTALEDIARQPDSAVKSGEDAWDLRQMARDTLAETP